MKSTSELNALKAKKLAEMNLENADGGARIVVGLATCGIAAGAKPVLAAFEKGIEERGLKNVSAVLTGCIGVCRLEPIVEVFFPGKEKVTYVKMTAEKIEKVIADHIVNNQVVTEYTIGAVE